MGKECQHCGRDDLYLDYDDRFPNKYHEGKQYFAPDEDVPHFMVCPENPYVIEKKQKEAEEQQKKQASQQKFYTPQKKKEDTKYIRGGTVADLIRQQNTTTMPAGDVPPISEPPVLVRIEKDISEIKAVQKTMMAMIEWIQQNTLANNMKKDEYRD